MIYAICFIYLIVLAAIYDFCRARSGRNINFVIALLLLICVAGFRYRVGGDTPNYMIFYKSLEPLSSFSFYSDARIKFQPLWMAFASLAKTVNSSFYSLQFFEAVVVNVSVFVFFRRVTKYYYTAILIYGVCTYPFFNFEIMRAALAISVSLWAFPAYRDRRWGVYYAIAVIAFLFHASAIVLFILPLLRRRQPPLFIVIAPALYIAGIFAAPYVGGLLASNSHIGWLIKYASEYSNYTYTMKGAIVMFIYYIVAPILLVKISRVDSSNERDALYSLAVSGIWIGALTSWFFIIFRLLNYFTPVYLVLAACIVHRFYDARGTRAIRVFAAICMLSVVLGFYSARYFSSTSKLVADTRWYSRWYPYYSVIDPRKDPIREQLDATGWP